MTFQEALKILGIEKYQERIFKSNSRGELFHIYQYIDLAEAIGTTEWFPKWFDHIVSRAEKTWDRPESVFQHTYEILVEQYKEAIDKRNSGALS